MNTKKTLLAATIGFFMGSGVHGAIAQEDVGGQEENGWLLEEVVVTAQKREERLIDVPMSISVFDTDTLEKTGVDDIHDLSYATSSLSVSEDFPGQTISIRGVSNGLGTSALVGVYLDDLPVNTQSSSSNINLQSLDLKRVEVLKGPQGTLYGQGSVGGAIRFITNPPSPDKFEAEAGFSSYTTKGGDWGHEITSITNIPVVDNKLAIRLAATYKDKGGWIDQPIADAKNTNSNKLSNIRLSGLWRNANNLEVRAMAIRYRLDGGGSNITNSRPATDAIYQLPTLNGSPLSSTDIANNYDLYNLTLEYDLGFANFVSSSSRIDVESNTSLFSSFYELAFAPQFTFNVNALDANESGKGLSQEFRLTGDGESMNWTVGFFYNNGEYQRKTDNLIILRDGVLLSQTSNVNNSRASSESYAFFGDISYDISHKLTLAMGTRYFEDKQTFKPSGLNSVDSDFDNISSRVSLSYAISENTNAFLSVSEGFRSGGLNDPSATGSTLPEPYDPESVLSYELGIKASLLQRKLVFEGAMFHSIYTDYLSFEFNPLTLTNLIQNASEARIRGIELAAQWAINKNISIGFNGDITDAEFTKLSELVSTVKEGDRLNTIPKYSYSLYGDIGFHISPSISGFSRIDISRIGPRTSTFRGTFVEDVVKTSSLTQVNAQIGANFNNLTVKLVGKNLSNEKRPTVVSPNNISTLLLPRTFGIDLDYKF